MALKQRTALRREAQPSTSCNTNVMESDLFERGDWAASCKGEHPSRRRSARLHVYNDGADQCLAGAKISQSLHDFDILRA